MNSKNSVRASKLLYYLLGLAFGMSLFIAVVMGGLLGLSSCATTPEGMRAEAAALRSLSNSVAGLERTAVHLPPPANSIAEVLLAAATAGLAAWNAHLHRRVLVMQNGGTSTSPPPVARPRKARTAAAGAR